MDKDIKLLVEDFRKEFEFTDTDSNKDQLEIIDDELDRRTWDAENTNEFGSNEHCYSIFDNMTTVAIQEFRKEFE